MAAITIQKLAPSTIFTILFLISNLTAITISQELSSQLPKKLLGNLKWPKINHLRFYFHDIVSGPNRTAVPIVAPINSSVTGFGSVTMIDDPLTLGPNMNSEIVGRAQGFYASADMQRLGLLMAMNFVFTEGEFSGSTLSLLGRNEVFSSVREMPIVGGTGAFRFGRGYAQAKTHDINAQVAVVEYNVYVFHY